MWIDDYHDTLNKIFLKRSKVDFLKNPAISDKPLFGREISMEPRELLYAVYDIERAYNISIPESVFLNKKFTTYQQILQSVEIILQSENKGNI